MTCPECGSKVFNEYDDCGCAVRHAVIEYLSHAPGWLEKDPDRSERRKRLDAVLLQPCRCASLAHLHKRENSKT